MSHKYEKLASTESAELETWQRTRPPQRALRILGVLKYLVLYSIAAFGMYSIAERIATFRHGPALHPISSSSAPSCDCGISIAEALLRDCRFDSLAMAWLPPHCRDDELTAEFQVAGDGPDGQWLYWADTEHTVPLTLNQVAEMADNQSLRVHMGSSWHRVHCVFYWRKQYRMPLAGKIVEPRSDSEGHIKHCGKVFEEPGYGTISGVALNTDRH